MKNLTILSIFLIILLKPLNASEKSMIGTWIENTFYMTLETTHSPMLASKRSPAIKTHFKSKI